MAVTHLTTAMASNRGTDFVNANGGVTGTNITGTIFSNGISLSVANPGAGGGVAISGDANSQSTGTVNFSNSNGVSFGLSNNGVMTASVQTNYQAPGAYLTTAMASNRGSDFVQATAAFAGTNASGTIASNGISVSVGNYITTAMLSNAATISNINVSGGTTSSNLSAINFVNSNGVSWSLDTASKLYATVATNYQSSNANYLTSQSNQAVSFTSGSVTFQTLSFTNSNGISFNSGTQGIFGSHNAITTGALSDHSHGNPTLNLTNLSGTTASASNGFTLSLSANAPAAGVGIAAGTRTATTAGNLLFDNANGVTFGLNLVGGSVMTASHNAITTGALSDHSHGNPTLALTNLSGTTASNSAGLTLSLSAAAPGGGAAVTVSASNGSFTVGQLNFSNANNVTFGTSAGSIVTASVAAPGGGGGYSINEFENIPYVTMTNLSNMTATRFTQRPHFYPFELGGSLTHNVLMFEASRATSGSNAFTMQAALYSMANSTQLSLIASLQNVFSNTATASISGIRRFHLTGWETAGTALTPGQYVMMIMNSGTATASMNYSYRGGLTAVPPVGVILGGTDQVQTATSYLSNAAGWRNFRGNYTTTTASPPATVGKNQIQNWTSGNNLYFYMGRT